MITLLKKVCANDHIICGFGYEQGKWTPAEVEAKLEEFMRQIHLNPWCEFCRDAPTRYVHEQTSFRTIEEAQPMLLRWQRGQMALRGRLMYERVTRN